VRSPIDSRQREKGRAVVLMSALCRRLPQPGGLENGAASVGDDVIVAVVNRAAGGAVENKVGQLESSWGDRRAGSRLPGSPRRSWTVPAALPKQLSPNGTQPLAFAIHRRRCSCVGDDQMHLRGLIAGSRGEAGTQSIREAGRPGDNR
jgi:hypothetical protein